MRKLTMSMCASRDYLEGYNRAVDDAAKDIDALRARVAELEARHEVMVNRELDLTVLMLRYRKALEELEHYLDLADEPCGAACAREALNPQA